MPSILAILAALVLVTMGRVTAATVTDPNDIIQLENFYKNNGRDSTLSSWYINVGYWVTGDEIASDQYDDRLTGLYASGKEPDRHLGNA